MATPDIVDEHFVAAFVHAVEVMLARFERYVLLSASHFTFAFTCPYQPIYLSSLHSNVKPQDQANTPHRRIDTVIRLIDTDIQTNGIPPPYLYAYPLPPQTPSKPPTYTNPPLPCRAYSGPYVRLGSFLSPESVGAFQDVAEDLVNAHWWYAQRAQRAVPLDWGESETDAVFVPLSAAWAALAERLENARAVVEECLFVVRRIGWEGFGVVVVPRTG
ncbi:uncharacterized protein K452DRAFT_344127 [Aplosporella prunicola CBS 121167]|uniref:Uncharacterized protein n=1 Tax=Aplosporella prunicola CBS 121167 TaxID=1176127 RepID=A0A6A6AYG7_9PEZI|nr:uncharacterized protein K452DRAFT_344127 [Aplosporella prunicola CBS 121167]KAF2136298.1 hypothetical protein K452DRAFT_344127 [Aplosporella prunicola CBS 121167]